MTTPRQLEAMTYKWAGRLELGGWRITVLVVPVEELPDAFAMVNTIIEQRRATIRFRADNLHRDDVEATVIHELLHLHLAPVEHELRQKLGEEYSASLASVAIEQAIHHISEAIAKLPKGPQ